MKRMLAVLMLIGILTGCAEKPLPAVVPETEAAEEKQVVVMPKSDAAHFAFREILETMYDTYACPTDDGFGEIELMDGCTMDNEGFAIADVDGDGEEELVVEIHDTFSAGMVLLVYNWDEEAKAVHNTLTIFPYAKFFANGNVQSFWGHNQGLAGDALWPYTWIEYDKAHDSYVSVADVDAWDKRFAETDYEGNPFPEEADKDGTGVVYLILSEDGQTVMSRSDFLAWETPLLTDSPALELPWLHMTKENVAMAATDRAGAEVTCANKDYLWQGQTVKATLKAGVTGIGVLSQDGTLLVTARLPKLLGVPSMAEIDTTDLNDDGYSDLNAVINYPDGTSAAVLWLSAGDTLYYNEEFSVLPGELSPRGEE